MATPAGAALAVPVSGMDEPTLEEQLSAGQTGPQYRYYERVLPEPEECVIVHVKGITDFGANVTLPEYGHAEGMILLSELSRRRIRSVNKLVRVGKTDVRFGRLPPPPTQHATRGDDLNTTHFRSS